MYLKYASPCASSENWTSGSDNEVRFRDGRNSSEDGGMNDVSVICGVNDGDCGKLEEFGKVDVVRFDSFDEG